MWRTTTIGEWNRSSPWSGPPLHYDNIVCLVLVTYRTLSLESYLGVPKLFSDRDIKSTRPKFFTNRVSWRNYDGRKRIFCLTCVLYDKKEYFSFISDNITGLEQYCTCLVTLIERHDTRDVFINFSFSYSLVPTKDGSMEENDSSVGLNP